jgi:valyl-tRNA synthetase
MGREITPPNHYTRQLKNVSHNWFVIASEGREQEVKYFNILKKEHTTIFQRQNLQIEVLKRPNTQHGDSSPKWVKEMIVDFLEHNNFDYDNFDNIRKEDIFFLIIDTDQWTEQEVLDVVAFCKQKDQFNLAISNPCFELWQILHLTDITNEIQAQFENQNTNTYSQICKKICNTDLKYNFQTDLKLENIKLAVQRAKKLDADKTIDFPIAFLSSKVYKVIDKLNLIPMEIPKTYNPATTEDKWYAYWLENKFFASKPDNREPYTIVIPPPNVTGVLHMGHMLNNTIQDVLIRKARMQGKNACWVPGTDHASIATEAKVVKMLADKGIKKKDLSREEFLKYAFEWKDKYGGIILEQLKKLGASCDWDRTKFTMDEPMSAQVIKVFVDLHKKGYIYRGVRMVNWDPQGKTALADDEVIHRETQSKMYYVKYQIAPQPPTGGANSPLQGAGGLEYITIATVRPETIMGDTAVCVHPDDERYKHLVGKKCIVPMINREIPIIADEYIDKDFGTGCLKVTPAHDINDYNLGVKHNLQVIDTISDDGTMSAAAQIFVGEDRFVARKKVAKLLDELGLLVKTEDVKNNVGYSERTDAVVEPKLSMQWFVEMKKLCEPALENVMNDNIQLLPPKFKNMYRSWMENVRDWCISRQLWWGQQIPAYYLPNGEYVVAENKEAAFEIAKTKITGIKIEELRQDEDVLDTWFSSALWPISVFDGLLDPDNEEINYYYPTNDLITAPEILFFWVARMILMGYEYRGKQPFKNVYLTGIVRDKLGRKMSKSLGNSPDPIELMQQYGADGVRTGMLFSSPAGNDLPFDEKLCEQGRNFSNKIWNAYRLIKGWEVDENLVVSYGIGTVPSSINDAAFRWFQIRLDNAIKELDMHYKNYKISDALQLLYSLIWDDFCSWYLELIKPAYQQPIDKITYNNVVNFFDNLMKLLHPFMPFITEEIWQNLATRDANDSICIATYPVNSTTIVSPTLMDDMASLFEVVKQIRNIRNSKGLSPKQPLKLYVKAFNASLYQDNVSIIDKLCNIDKEITNISSIAENSKELENAISFYVEPNAAQFFVPLSQKLDIAAEKLRLETDLAYQRGFLESVMKKVGNEKFMANAKPEVRDSELKKKADAESKIKALEEALAGL